ncbi:MAG: hypothetical protein QXS37_05550 [Candidatus Aenigmatarchaeota archaeon]
MEKFWIGRNKKIILFGIALLAILVTTIFLVYKKSEPELGEHIFINIEKNESELEARPIINISKIMFESWFENRSLKNYGIKYRFVLNFKYNEIYFVCDEIEFESIDYFNLFFGKIREGGFLDDIIDENKTMLYRFYKENKCMDVFLSKEKLYIVICESIERVKSDEIIKIYKEIFLEENES